MKQTKKYNILIKNHTIGSFVVCGKIPLLEALEKVGLSLPYGCRYGGCVSCAAKLISGEIKQKNATALNTRQLKKGYILLCVAKPLTDCVLEVGVESHDELYLNPFTYPHNNACLPSFLRTKEESR